MAVWRYFGRKKDQIGRVPLIPNPLTLLTKEFIPWHFVRKMMFLSHVHVVLPCQGENEECAPPLESLRRKDYHVEVDCPSLEPGEVNVKEKR